MVTITVLEKIKDALLAGATVNPSVQAAPTAVLWTDKEGLWSSALTRLQAVIPSLVTLGPYDRARRSGPAVWLKCAIAGVLDDINLDGLIPVIYLPNVSRADLRAIECCPRELQPLAELQYRGVFWSQANSKDWTINAFLTSKAGGLGLDLAQDRATQQALHRALEAGELLDRPISELQGRQINAEWLDSLLAPNPTRDILAWLNDSDWVRLQWGTGRWAIFMSRCKKDFGFDPEGDGELVAAEKLAMKEGAWAAVWEQYTDSYPSFPNVVDQLERVSSPASSGLFDDVSGFARVNVEQEAALCTELDALGHSSPTAARETIKEAEQKHGLRRHWLWAKMGRAPLATALSHLTVVAELSRKIPSGSTPNEMARRYEEEAWHVDAEAMMALASVRAKADIKAISSALGAIYVSWLDDTAQRFQQLVREQGGLSKEEPKSDTSTDHLCTIFVDGLRYDVAVELKSRLNAIGTTSLSTKWTSLPSVTASGKAWVSPVAGHITGKPTDEDFEPSVTSDGKALNTYNFRKLLNEHGFQTLSKHEMGDPHGKAWVECGDLDHYGHEHGLRLARDLDGQLTQIVERVQELKDAGWRRFRIVTDHGWLLVPGGLPKTELSKFETQTRWGRCAVLKDSSHGTPLTFGWDWCKTVQIAMAPGISNFIAGAEYAHGGISLQECLVPVIDMLVSGSSIPQIKIEISKVSWRGLRCSVEISQDLAGLRADIRTKAALAESSVAASTKVLVDRKASLAVADDGLLGVSAVVVIVDANGAVLQKVSTTIGESD